MAISLEIKVLEVRERKRRRVEESLDISSISLWFGGKDHFHHDWF